MSIAPSIAAPVAGLMMLAALRAMAQAPSCEPLLTPTALQAPAVAQAFHAWMCSTRFVSHREFIDAGVAYGIDVYGQRLLPNWAIKPTERDAWKKLRCSTAMVGARPAEATRTLLGALPAADVQRFARCRNSTTTRIACAIVPGVRSATVTVRWKGGESRPAGIRPQVLATDVAGGVVQRINAADAAASAPEADWVADIPIATELCDGVVAVIETTFGFCAVPAYMPAPMRREEIRLFDADARGNLYSQTFAYGTQNRGHLVRDLQIETRTVALSDRLGEITSVSYSCRNPVNFDRCPWSRNPDTNDTSANVVIAADKRSFTWKRLWSGDPVDDIYTVRYRLPRAVCIENCECPAR